MPQTDTERFASYVNVTDTCHLWTGKLDRDGYALFWYAGKWIPAHRFAYGLDNIPDGYDVDHVLAKGCDNRHCVNRDHLEAVTHAVNLERRADRISVYELDNGETTEAKTEAAPVIANSFNGRDESGRWAKGNAGGPGRPRKGESFAEQYMKRLDREAEPLIDAHIRRAKGNNVVAERAFATALAYKIGVPKQTFVVETQDSPMAALLTELAQLQALPAPYVEGESRDATHDTP